MSFYQPLDMEELFAILAKEPQVTILAGGTDVLVQRRSGQLKTGALLDITRIAQLRKIGVTNGTVQIGATATFSEIERNSMLQTKAPLLCAAAAEIGSPQIRSRGTIGGNVANASPAADAVTALLALDAIAVIRSGLGVRQIPVSALLLGAGTSGLQRGELITAFTFVAPTANTACRFSKIGRRNAVSIARLNGACVLEMHGTHMYQVRICLGAATKCPQRFPQAEAVCEGREANAQTLRQAGEAVAKQIEAQTGNRASSAYKLPVAVDFVADLIQKTAEEGAR